MSFIYDSDNTKDNEKKKFQPDSVGDVSVNVKSNDIVEKLNRIIYLLELLTGGEELFDQEGVLLQDNLGNVLTGVI